MWKGCYVNNTFRSFYHFEISMVVSLGWLDKYNLEIQYCVIYKYSNVIYFFFTGITRNLFLLGIACIWNKWNVIKILNRYQKNLGHPNKWNGPKTGNMLINIAKDDDRFQFIFLTNLLKHMTSVACKKVFLYNLMGVLCLNGYCILFWYQALPNDIYLLWDYRL